LAVYNIIQNLKINVKKMSKWEQLHVAF